MVVKSKLLFSLLFVASCVIAGEKTVADYMKMSLQELKEADAIADNAHKETSEHKAAILADEKVAENKMQMRLAWRNLIWSGDESDYQQKVEKCVEAMLNRIEVEREQHLAYAAESNTETIKKALELYVCVVAKEKMTQC